MRRPGLPGPSPGAPSAPQLLPDGRGGWRGPGAPLPGRLSTPRAYPLQPRRCGPPARPPGSCSRAPRFVSPPAVASSPRQPPPSFGRRLPRGPYEAGALALPHSLRPFPRQPRSALPPPAPPPPGSLPTRPPASLERGSAPSSPGPAGAPSPRLRPRGRHSPRAPPSPPVGEQVAWVRSRGGEKWAGPETLASPVPCDHL